MARILCVEDQSDLLLLYIDILQAKGHAVAPFASVAGAMHHLVEEGADLLLTDWSLGLQTAAPLIEAAHSRQMPTMVLTGRLEECGLSGIQTDLVVEKPISAAELTTFVRDLLTTGEEPQPRTPGVYARFVSESFHGLSMRMEPRLAAE